MKNLKLILKSLVNNNACIEGGRKKPWYFAAIMFFLAMIFAILPLFVQTWNTNGDDTFKTYAYGTDQATLRFTEYLNDNNIQMYIKTPDGAENKNDKIIVASKDGVATNVDYEHKIPVKASDGTYTEQIDFKFYYRVEKNETEFTDLIGDQKTSFFIFYQDQIYINLVNFETKAVIKTIVCNKAANKFEDGKSINAMLSTSTDASTKLNETFANWKLFIRDAYNFTRLTAVWQTCAIMGGINAGITLFMGLMIWILTRGKNNPYRLFNLWETQKMSWWAAITPSILALAFGFLIPRFANVLFPMLIGIRVMWLSMKSLRPDGSGYAAE